MIVGKDGATGILMLTEKGKGSMGDMESVDSGAKVRVVADPAPDADTKFTKSPVRIMILDGKHAGLPGVVDRGELRPLR